MMRYPRLRKKLGSHVQRQLPSTDAFGARRSAFVLCVGLLVLTGCARAPLQIAPSDREMASSTQFVSVRSPRAWVNLPTALMVTQRALRDSEEQRIGLPNSTTVAGDNLVILRAHSPRGADHGRLVFTDFMRRIGSPPTPFERLASGEMRTGEDSLGHYLWAEQRTGSGTICILGMRRLTEMDRQIPNKYAVLDVMVRNCVDGPVDQALLPITDAYIGFGYGVSNGVPDGKSRMMSALAGPTPR
jgi:hypothetical protein